MGHTTDMTGANTLCYGITGPKRLLAGRLLERHRSTRRRHSLNATVRSPVLSGRARRRTPVT
jgi:hypothetical protein